MDIYCPRCGEPFEIDSLGDSVGETIVLPGNPGGAEVRIDSVKKAADIFYKYGCGVLTNGVACKRDKSMRTEFSSALRDLLGDDIDGIASELEDAEYLGLI